LSDFSIINSVFGKLKADSTFLAYFGLTTASTMPEIVKKIQKEIDPDGLTKDNIPLVCIYPIPGLRSRVNGCVYDGMFEVAIYSDNSTGVKSATTKAGTMRIGARAMNLLHYVQLSGDTFKTEFQSSFQSSSGVSGIKKYIMRFKVSEVID
jgi:hypothetical protein